MMMMMKCCFTSTGTGAQDVHLDFHRPPELRRPKIPCNRSLYKASYLVQIPCNRSLYKASYLVQIPCNRSLYKASYLVQIPCNRSLYKASYLVQIPCNRSLYKASYLVQIPCNRSLYKASYLVQIPARSIYYTRWRDPYDRHSYARVHSCYFRVNIKAEEDIVTPAMKE